MSSPTNAGERAFLDSYEMPAGATLKLLGPDAPSGFLERRDLLVDILRHATDAAHNAGRASRDEEVALLQSQVNDYFFMVFCHKCEGSGFDQDGPYPTDAEIERGDSCPECKGTGDSDFERAAEERGRRAGLMEAAALAEKVAELSGEDIMLELSTKLRKEVKP